MTFEDEEKKEEAIAEDESKLEGKEAPQEEKKATGDLDLNELESTEEKPDAKAKDNPEIEPELDAVYDIPVQVSAVLGKATMPVNQLLKLGRGAVVELDRRVGEAIDIYVNNRLVARGEVVVVEDRLGITMTEIIKSQA